MAQLKDSLVTGDLRVTGTIYGIGSSITNIDAGNISLGTLPVSRGGTGQTSFSEGAALIGNGTGAIGVRSITNLTAAGDVTSNTNLITANTLNYWKGTANVVKLGTVTTGTWHATAVGAGYGGTGRSTLTSNAVITGNGTSAVNMVATASGALYATAANGAPTFGTLPVGQGGTGQTTLAQYGILVGNGANAITVVGANTTATKKFLRMTGTGSAGAAPAWDTLVAADIPNLDASKITSGTLAVARGGTGAATANANIVFAGPSSGSAAAPSFRVLVAADIPDLSTDKLTSGKLPVSRGGTGQDSFASNGIITGNGSNALKVVATANGAAYATSANGTLTFGTLPFAQGGTGQTSGVNAANSLLNQLSTGSSTPVDADYYISQYVGGGTTTTTYHRRPMSALWAYVNGKTDALYEPKFTLLGVSKGGTGQNSLTQYGVVVGNGTNAVSVVTPNSTVVKKVLTMTGTGSAGASPTWESMGNAKIFSGTCATAAATTEKAVVCTSFTSSDLVKGAIIYVTFDNTNSGAVGSITLNVNGTGAKPIKYMYNNAVNSIPAVGYILANETYIFHYDGTNWVIDNMHYNTNTTYSAMSQSEATTGTAGTGRLITAKVLHDTIYEAMSVNDAMIFKGTIGSSGATVTALPDTHERGWTYKVATAGTYAGVVCEVGDMIICTTDGTAANNAEWAVIQTNIDGAVTGPTSATDGAFALFNGNTGRIIKNSNYTPSSFAASGHNHDSVYVNVTGDTMTGALIIKKTTAATNTYDDANPKIIFQNSNASQNASLTFTDYDTIQSPASLTLNGNQGGEYFIAPNIKATSNFYGSGANLTSLNASNLASGTVPIARIPTGTSGTTVALGNHTHNYAGSSSAGGAATSLANFKVTTSTNLWAVDSPTTNAVGYQSGLTAANWNYQRTDGAIYTQFYSSNWIHQIFGDYRTGQISVRGKNNGTWQAWRRVLDETNGATILGLKALAYKDSLTAADVGLGNVANKTITVTTTSVSDGTTTFSKYTHPTTSGNKHIPSGGSSGQFLGWSSDGTAAWVANPNSDTKNTAGSTNSDSKLFLIGATSQAANPQTYSDSEVFTTNGTLSAKILSTTAGVNANTANSGTAGGVSLYGTTPTDYGVTMRNTGTSSGQLGKHGYVQGDWAGYFCFTGATNRGYIFRHAGANVASISGLGHAVFNGSVTVGGNTANTSGARMEYDATVEAIGFTFV